VISDSFLFIRKIRNLKISFSSWRKKHRKVELIKRI